MSHCPHWPRNVKNSNHCGHEFPTFVRNDHTIRTIRTSTSLHAGPHNNTSAIRLIVRLQFCEMPRDCSKEKREAILMDVDRDLKAELKNCNTLNVMKIMGAIVNPLFQNKNRMMAAGLCTELQYKHGKAELIRRIARAYDRIEGAVEIVNDPNENKNEW